jgi:predicted TIM-barrel fold metal-dependent hydrolase
MARKYRVISADGHVEGPPMDWEKYVPEKYREWAPRMVKLEEGGEGWIVEGLPIVHTGQNVTGAGKIKFRNASYWNPDGTRVAGAGTPEQRLREQDLDGVDAEVLYPPIFATRFIERISNQKAYVAMVQAYNTYLARDFCAVAPDRLLGNAVIPVSGIEDAVSELKRAKDLGLRSVTLAQFPNGGGSPRPEDDRFWETALSIGMAVSPHVSMGDWAPPRTDLGRGTGDTPIQAALSGGGANPSQYCMMQCIFSGLLDRFPDLCLYFAETNASWLATALWFMDDRFKAYNDWYNVKLKMLPSEYVRKHFLFGFIRDPLAMRLREYLPEDHLMWGSDFPHSVGSYPKSRGWLDIIFEGVPETTRRKILVDTPAAFFGLDLSKELTPTPGVKEAVTA